MLWKHSLGHHNGVRQHYSFTVLKSHKSALDRQITEAVLIQIAGPDMLLNSHGEWNICKIPRLVLDDDEPMEDWVSTRSKQKNISVDPGPSSGSSSSTSSDSNKNEGGDGSKEYGVVCESDSVDMDVSTCNESKSKRSRQAEPTLPITSGLRLNTPPPITSGLRLSNLPTTPGLSTAAETDITRNELKEYRTDCTEDGVQE